MGVCMTVYHVRAWYLWSPEEGVAYPGTGVTDDCELPHGGLGTKHRSSARAVMLLAPEYARNSF